MNKSNRRNSYRELMKKPAWALVNLDGLIATTRADNKKDAKAIFERSKILEPGMVIMRMTK